MGFMVITMFFSMWMSNTATTAMVAPMVEAVIENLTEASYQGKHTAFHKSETHVSLLQKLNKLSRRLSVINPL